jgi:hypothetical protein
MGKYFVKCSWLNDEKRKRNKIFNGLKVMLWLVTAIFKGHILFSRKWT